MIPTIAKIIFVAKLEPFPAYKLIQTISFFTFCANIPGFIIFRIAINLLTNHEHMQMVIFPAHCNLQNIVQLA